MMKIQPAVVCALLALCLAVSQEARSQAQAETTFSLFIAGRDIDRLRFVRGEKCKDYYTDYTAEFTATIGRDSATWQAEARSHGCRSWYFYSHSERIGVTCREYLAGAATTAVRVPADVLEAIRPPYCECDEDALRRARAQAAVRAEQGEMLVEESIKYREEALEVADNEFWDELKHAFVAAGPGVGLGAGIEIARERWERALMEAKARAATAAGRTLTVATLLDLGELFRRWHDINRRLRGDLDQAREMQRAGLEMGSEAVDEELAAIRTLNQPVCSSARERERALQELRWQAHELISEWMLPGGRYYVDPVTDEPLNVDAALKRAKELLSGTSRGDRPRSHMLYQVALAQSDSRNDNEAVTNAQVAAAVAEIDRALELASQAADRYSRWREFQEEVQRRVREIQTKFRALY